MIVNRDPISEWKFCGRFDHEDYQARWWITWTSTAGKSFINHICYLNFEFGDSVNCQVAISNQIFACLADISSGNHGTIMKKQTIFACAALIEIMPCTCGFSSDGGTSCKLVWLEIPAAQCNNTICKVMVDVTLAACLQWVTVGLDSIQKFLYWCPNAKVVNPCTPRASHQKHIYLAPNRTIPCLVDHAAR